MKKPLIFIGILALLIQIGCQKENCEGFDNIIELNNVFLFGEDTLQYFDNIPNQFFGISMTIFGDYESKDGNRNCDADDLAFKLEDVIEVSSISLKCDKTLNSGSQTFPANSELSGTSIARVNVDQNSFGQLSQATIDLIGVDGFTQDDDYTFTLKLKTQNNKSFTDDYTVHIKD